MGVGAAEGNPAHVHKGMGAAARRVARADDRKAEDRRHNRHRRLHAHHQAPDGDRYHLQEAGTEVVRRAAAVGAVAAWGAE
jgi:hypothetical protein